MTNMENGYLVIEGCFHCRSRISFFSREPVPPVDDYQEGDHYWSYLGNYQASRFDLKCKTCGQAVPLKEIMALMLCMRCDPECGVFQAGSGGDGQKTWTYVALCANTSHKSGACIMDESLRALSEYFNASLQDVYKRILVVPCRLRKSVDTCQGIVVADVGLTDLY